MTLKTLPTDLPLISCVMPTGNRKPFAMQAVRYFQRQDYESRELLVLDDGKDNLSREIGNDDRIRYVPLPSGLTIGAKRNIGCELARGAIIAHWDDDDWYAPFRLRSQAMAILSDSADVTALSNCVFLDLPKWVFWECSPRLFMRMFVGRVHGGTLVFRASLFRQGIRYPEVSEAEDAAFLYQCHRSGARLERIPGDGLFVYLRHARCAWRFKCGAFIAPREWVVVPQPCLPSEDLAFLKHQSVSERSRSAKTTEMSPSKENIDC
jgi:glycosyltransferase involved in cell wall biosynthesis